MKRIETQKSEAIPDDQSNSSTPEKVVIKDKHVNILKNTVENANEYNYLMKNFKEKDSDGLYLIDTGVCSIINSYDKWEVKKMTRGDFVGEAAELKVPVSL